MKKWQKALVSAVSAVVVLCAAGAAAFKFYIEPKYMDKVITTAQQVVNNQALNDSVSELVQQLEEEGKLDEKTKEMYEQTFSSDDAEKIDDFINSGEVESIIEEAQKQEQTTDAPKKSESSEKKQPESSPKKKSEEKQPTSVTEQPAEENKNQESEKKPSPTKAPSKSEGSTAQERIKAAASAEEYAAGLRIISKIDIGKAQSLYKTDKAACMQYLKENLSQSEINQALQLYMKYKDLL